MIAHLAASGFLRTRWKNGGGETVEIAVSPEGAGLDAFDWRVSMARVAASGPFSIFPGVDRTLCVLTPGEIRLEQAGRGAVSLDARSAPYSFPADVSVIGHVTGDGITDLNVMTRRAKARHQVSRLWLEGPIRLPVLAREMLILTLEAALTGPEGLGLKAGDALLVRDEKEIALEPERPGAIHVVDLW